MISEIKLPERNINLRGLQRDYVESIRDNTITFAVGAAGTGKTFLAVAYALHLLNTKSVRKIVLVRPAVEAGEKLGFLPGDISAKIDPYLRPIYDAISDCVGDDKDLSRHVEIAPLAFMRGRTLNNAAILLDEAQNSTPKQLLMFMTRLGHHSKMIIVGDTSQIDLENQSSGLIDAVKRLQHLEGVGVVNLTKAEIHRHPLVSKVIESYEQ